MQLVNPTTSIPCEAPCTRANCSCHNTFADRLLTIWPCVRPSSFLCWSWRCLLADGVVSRALKEEAMNFYLTKKMWQRKLACETFGNIGGGSSYCCIHILILVIPISFWLAGQPQWATHIFWHHNTAIWQICPRCNTTVPWARYLGYGSSSWQQPTFYQGTWQYYCECVCVDFACWHFFPALATAFLPAYFVPSVVFLHSPNSVQENNYHQILGGAYVAMNSAENTVRRHGTNSLHRPTDLTEFGFNRRLKK